MHGIRLYIAATVLLLSARPGVCKCANRFIYIDAQLVGSSGDNYRIKVEVTPDPNWEPQPEITINDGVVKGKILFNTTKSEGRFRDNCSRAPKTVEVVLLNGDREVDRVRLDISRDFVKTEFHDYKLRMPIKLRKQMNESIRGDANGLHRCAEARAVWATGAEEFGFGYD